MLICAKTPDEDNITGAPDGWKKEWNLLTAGEVKAASKEDLTVALLHKWLTGDDGAPAQDDLHDYLESVYGINKKGDKNWTALKLKISGDAPKATPMESLLSLMTKAIEAKSGGGAAPAASATGSPYIKTVKLVDKRAMSLFQTKCPRQGSA